MNDSTRVGLFLTFVGFFVVGSASIYSVSANPQTIQEIAQLARNVATAEGAGWIFSGLGLVLAFYGLAADLDDLRTVVPDVAAIEQSGRAPEKIGHLEFVCSECGGDISKEAKMCPHCGAPIEGE